MINLISDILHYDIVLNLAIHAKRSLWIGTADIKDLYVIQGELEKPFLGILAELIGKGVEVRLIHAKEQFRSGCVIPATSALKRHRLLLSLHQLI